MLFLGRKNPNILLTNVSTYRKIDMYAQMHPNRLVTADNDGNIETIETLL